MAAVKHEADQISSTEYISETKTKNLNKTLKIYSTPSLYSLPAAMRKPRKVLLTYYYFMDRFYVFLKASFPSCFMFTLRASEFLAFMH